MRRCDSEGTLTELEGAFSMERGSPATDKRLLFLDPARKRNAFLLLARVLVFFDQDLRSCSILATIPAGGKARIQGRSRSGTETMF